MSIVLLSSDLMSSSQLAGPAQQQGLSLQTAMSVEDLSAKCGEGKVVLVVLDLSMSNLDVAEVVATLRTSDTPPAVVAFGPHVHEAKLQAAQQAGCDGVFSRGQFFSRAGEIFVNFADA